MVSLDHISFPAYLGVDVGGTTIKIGIVDNSGRSFAHGKIDTDHERGPEDGVRRIIELAEGLLAESGLNWEQIRAIGLGTPGTMDVKQGMLLHMPNMSGWDHFPIRSYLADQTDKPVAFLNDANAAAYGEYWVGRGQECDSLVMFTLGTGVGGGIIIQDITLDGAHSHGSELGHITIDSSADARQCPCGQFGHLEAYVSATSVAKRTQEQLDEGEESSLQTTWLEQGMVSSLDVATHAEQGDEFANRMIRETGHYLAIGITSVLHMIDPDIVVLGGAMNFGGHQTRAGQAFLEAIHQRIRELTFPVLAENTIIDFATLGSDSGFIGAAGVARKQFG
ncbi:MAG: glucokinase [Rhodopirellula sp.]|nr:glucokinase [Rhodopirellula sp.]|tara:strand:+ start:3786 stop:4793 length:1008 start_codon:yes stop_codon:yes gene_type:complete